MLRYRSRTSFVLIAASLLAGSAAVSAQTTPPAATADAPSLRTSHEAGTQVCRNSADGSLRYQGSIAGYERSKLQILINTVTHVSDGSPLAGFHATSVWDDPDNWAACK